MLLHHEGPGMGVAEAASEHCEDVDSWCEGIPVAALRFAPA